MTRYGGHGANYSYGATSTPAAEPERFSPGTRILISALPVLPTILISLLSSLLLRADWVKYWPEPLRNLWALGCSAILSLYFLIVVAIWARQARRSAAVIITLVTILFDIAWLAALLFVFRSSDTGLLAWVFVAGQVLITVGYVAAWGVARRRTGIWAVGLIAAVVCGSVVQWIKSWALNIGAFVSCVRCWALDALD